MEKKFSFKSIFESSIFNDTYIRFVWRFIWNCSSTLFLLFMFMVIYLIVYEGVYKEWIYPNLPKEESMELMEEADTKNTLVVFKQGKEWGYLNSLTGGPLPERYDYAWPFSEGMAAVMKDKRLMFIDPKGKVVINTEFGRIPEGVDCKFIQGYCVVNSREGLTGLIDKQGNWALQPIYDEISHTNGLWKVRSYDLYGLFSSSLDTLFTVKHPRIDVEDEAIEVSLKNHIVKRYDYNMNVLEDFVIYSIEELSTRDFYKENEFRYTVAKQMCYAVNVENESTFYYGLMDRNGKRITPPDYTSIEAIGKDLYFCKPQGILINGKGERVK